MNLIDVQTALVVLMESGGQGADASCTIKHNEVMTYFRPLGWGNDRPSVLGYGAEPLSSIEDAAKKWAEISSDVRRETIKKMALAIIRTTHEQGACTDAALRAEFGAKDVDQYGLEAVSVANAMADSGPFEIIALQGANAA